MGIFEGLKKWFRKRKADKRNEPKHLKVVYKPKAPKPSKALIKAREVPKGQRGRGWKRRARRQYCPGSIIPAALRPLAPREELMRHMPPWFKRQLRREALQAAFPPKPEAVMTTPERRELIQSIFGPSKMLDPLALENQPNCIKPQILAAGPPMPTAVREKLDE